MLDIGLGEILLIAVLALLVFGPDRLPRVAADAARVVRQVRQLSVQARRNLVDAAGIVDEDGELRDAVREIRDLDPRRAAWVLAEQDSAAGGLAAQNPASASAASSVGSSADGAPDPVTRSATVGPGAPGSVADPDWT